MSPFVRSLLEIMLVLGVLLGAARWLTGLFGRRATVFRATTARHLRLAFWPLLALGTGLSVLPAVALGGSGSAFEWALAGVFGVATLLLGGPALLLHARYYALNAHTALVFEPAANRLEVFEKGQRRPFERRDLAAVDYVTCRAPHSFRAPYAYLRLRLRNGEEIILTTLLAELWPLAEFLRSVPGRRAAVAWPWPPGRERGD